jgi:hypothetical protein
MSVARIGSERGLTAAVVPRGHGELYSGCSSSLGPYSQSNGFRLEYDHANTIRRPTGPGALLGL